MNYFQYTKTNKKKIAVICNDIEWKQPSGYSFANGLYFELSKKHIVKILMVLEYNFFGEAITHINPNMTIEKIFMSDETVIDYSNSSEGFYKERFLYKDKKLIDKVRESVKDYDVIICNSIFVSKLVCTAFPDKEIVYRALDTFSYAFDEQIKYSGFEKHKEIEDVKLVFDALENEVVEKAKYILTLTEQDEKIFSKQCNIDSDKFIRMPLCVEQISNYKNLVPSEKKKSTTIDCIVLSNHFFGSDMLLKKIIEIAPKLPNVVFKFIGTCCSVLSEYTLPGNCVSYGVVSNEERDQLISNAHCAISLLFQTHGMNAKNFDYILGGVTILSDEDSVRGLNFQRDIHYINIEFETLEDDLISFLNKEHSEIRQIALNAYNHVISNYKYENYISKFEEKCKLTTELSNSKSNDSNNYYIWGAGANGLACLKYLDMMKFNCIGFIDGNSAKHGTEVNGKQIHDLNLLDVNELIQNNVNIIIAVKSVVSVLEIYKQIKLLSTQIPVRLFYNNFLLEEEINLNE